MPLRFTVTPSVGYFEILLIIDMATVAGVLLKMKCFQERFISTLASHGTLYSVF